MLFFVVLSLNLLIHYLFISPHPLALSPQVGRGTGFLFLIAPPTSGEGSGVG